MYIGVNKFSNMVWVHPLLWYKCVKYAKWQNLLLCNLGFNITRFRLYCWRLYDKVLARSTQSSLWIMGTVYSTSLREVKAIVQKRPTWCYPGIVHTSCMFHILDNFAKHCGIVYEKKILKNCHSDANIDTFLYVNSHGFVYTLHETINIRMEMELRTYVVRVYFV